MSQKLLNLEMTSTEQKSLLCDLRVKAAKEVDCILGNKVTNTPVLFERLKYFHNLQHHLVSPLEKKFSGRCMIIISQHDILSKSHSQRVKTKTLRRRSLEFAATNEASFNLIPCTVEFARKIH